MLKKIIRWVDSVGLSIFLVALVRTAVWAFFSALVYEIPFWYNVRSGKHMACPYRTVDRICLPEGVRSPGEGDIMLVMWDGDGWVPYVDRNQRPVATNKGGANAVLEWMGF